MSIPPSIPEQPPLMDATWAAYVGVVATILIGIFFTKDDKRNFENIVGNIVSFALLLATVQFTWLTLMLMGVYLVIGIIIAIEKMRKWFFLFGSKTYGSLALMVLMVDSGFFGFTLLDVRFGQPVLLLLEFLSYIFIGWIILASVSHLVGYLYWRRPAPKPRKSKSDSTSLQALISGFVSKARMSKGSRRGRGRRRGKGNAGSSRRRKGTGRRRR